MYNIGDYIVHPMHGAGVIDAIVQEKVSGTLQSYYVFKMSVGGLVLKVPVTKSEIIGIRPVLQRQGAWEALDALATIEVEQTANWSKRYRDNLERVKSGDLREVAKVIKGLVHRERQRGLSTGERKMLQTAKQIFISEIVLSTQMEHHEVDSCIAKALAVEAN